MFNQINLTFSLLMVEQKQQIPNFPNEGKANDYELSFWNDTMELCSVCRCAQTSWFYKLACSNPTGT